MSNVTHIKETDISGPSILGSVDIYADGIGNVEEWDFSRGNISRESRIYNISLIASVCYGNPKAVGSTSLYDRLSCESAGLPSSSFEFVPVLIAGRLDLVRLKLMIPNHYRDKTRSTHDSQLNVEKYGELVEGGEYILTNLRALIADVGDGADEFFNTEEECKIISKHYKVFKARVPIFVARQYMRHRVSWQEMSRRYVSGKKSPLEFYVSPKMEDLLTTDEYNINHSGDFIDFNTEEINKLCINHYNNAITEGIKPEVARQVLPVSLYTTIWSAWQPRQLEVFYKLRLDSHAQLEIRQLAEAKKGTT